VEALGYDMNVVSTITGAIGVDANICNGKLVFCKNEDWQGFADKMLDAIQINQSIGSGFFDYFYWDNIAKKAAGIVDNL
jgi:hypothetical protein